MNRFRSFLVRHPVRVHDGHGGSIGNAPVRFAVNGVPVVPRQIGGRGDRDYDVKDMSRFRESVSGVLRGGGYGARRRVQPYRPIAADVPDDFVPVPVFPGDLGYGDDRFRCVEARVEDIGHGDGPRLVGGGHIGKSLPDIESGFVCTLEYLRRSWMGHIVTRGQSLVGRIPCRVLDDFRVVADAGHAVFPAPFRREGRPRLRDDAGNIVRDRGIIDSGGPEPGAAVLGLRAYAGGPVKGGMTIPADQSYASPVRRSEVVMTVPVCMNWLIDVPVDYIDRVAIVDSGIRS